MIRLSDVVKEYESGTTALKGISLRIEDGEFVFLVGPSGSGKSTLLRQLKTCLTPHGETGGTVRFGDALLKDIPFAEQARRIGFVLQHPDDQIVTDKVFHELAFGLESLGCDETAMRLRVAEMASYFGIADWFERDVQTLSGGQKQMLNLASVVVMRPDVLILDEPTRGVDVNAKFEIYTVINELAKEGITISYKAISNWERNLAEPSVTIFYKVCRILGITNMYEAYFGVNPAEPFSSLTDEGREKAMDYINLLHASGMYEK